jgi:hypothetical protein
MPDLQVITLKVRLVYIMVLIFVDRWSKMVTKLVIGKVMYIFFIHIYLCNSVEKIVEVTHWLTGNAKQL